MQVFWLKRLFTVQSLLISSWPELRGQKLIPPIQCKTGWSMCVTHSSKSENFRHVLVKPDCCIISQHKWPYDLFPLGFTFGSCGSYVYVQQSYSMQTMTKNENWQLSILIYFIRASHSVKPFLCYVLCLLLEYDALSRNISVSPQMGPA